jgi:hypothetical protein
VALKSGEYPEVEDAVYTWFLQEHNRHTPVSGEIILEKAKYFCKMIMVKDDFRASDGWLVNLRIWNLFSNHNGREIIL